MQSALLPCQKRAALLSSCARRPLNAAHASTCPATPRTAVACRAAAVASVSYDVADEAVLRSLERPTNNIVSLGSRGLPRFIAVKEPTSWVPSSLPGPGSDESSGLDFVDLVNTPRPEVQARLQDAATYLMLGCANGVLQRVSAAAAAVAPVNVRALTRFRNNVTRNLSPAVAVSCSDAMQAAKAATKRRVQELLEQQRATASAIHGAGALAGAASSSFAGGSGAGSIAQAPCRFVVAPAFAEQPLETPVPALCINSESDSADGAAAPVIVVAADVSASVGAHVAAPAEAQEPAAEHAVAPASSVGAPSLSGDDLDALQHPSEQQHHTVGGGGSGRRRGSRGRGLGGAGRLQDQSDAAWI